MSAEQKSLLETELSELFDIRSRKLRQEKVLHNEALQAKHDMKLVVLMFSEGIPDISVRMSDQEHLDWDSRLKRLVYHRGEVSQYVEAASNEILVKIRPHLRSLVHRAKEMYC